MIPCGLPAYPLVPTWTEWLADAAVKTTTPPSDMAGWVGWIVVLTFVGLFDWWLLRRHKDTMSKKVLKWARRLAPFRIFVVSVLVIFAWHLAWGVVVVNQRDAFWFVVCCFIAAMILTIFSGR